MEVNKELISYIKASELPKVDNPVSGDLIHAQGDNLSATPISYFIDKISSGIYGRLITSTVVPGTGYYKYDVAQAGTYTNINPAITITQQELDENFVFVTVNNGVAEKLLSKKPNSKVETWSTKAYEKGSQVFYEGAIYEAPNGAVDNNRPEDGSDVWVLKVKGFVARSNSKSLLQFEDATGQLLATWDLNGNFYTNYDKNIIPLDSVAGLEYIIRELRTDTGKLKEYLFTYNAKNWKSLSAQQLGQLRHPLLSSRDSGNYEFLNVDENGELYIPKLKVDHLKISDVDNAENEPVFEGTEIVLPEQKFLRLNFLNGSFPTDRSEVRTAVKMKAALYGNDGELIAILNTEMAIQGQYSAQLNKLGYSIDLFNSSGKSVSVKFGDLPSLKGFHLKAFYTDFTHTRDVGAGKMWQSFAPSRPWPYNLFKGCTINEEPNTLNFEKFSADAQYALIGIPCEVSYNGSFVGLFTWRTKKTDSVFAVNSKRDTCIFIESQAQLAGTTPVGLGAPNYPDFSTVQIAYEIRSPKPKNITQKTKDKTMRFFNWWKGVYNGSIDLRATHQDYINLIHWLDWIILAEWLIHWDSIHNNAAYITYDGDHWSPLIIDCDHTLDNDRNRQNLYNQFVIYEDVFAKIKQVFSPEIKVRYKELRTSGVLSMNSVMNIYGGISKNIPWDTYVKDFKKWSASGWWWEGRFVPSLDLLYNTAQKRIQFLDSQWLTS
ncbi:CotH kinase family protein [Elizabethkingia ursingii]|uniref:CotH kinase family protein n=1 Tax=Elizabethkingia ursingii TaxID=1756150 RepID=UPI002012EAB6|nr:CotH kinase family protein [Elizabethkingia ursingii]MCL1673611.1 CotH kinase family protein [Elizabethkingia ursingii]